MDFLVYAVSSFGLGALHVLEPGHGKMLVLAYLVGSKGRTRDAVVLGVVTAFTHTFVVIVLGILSTVAAVYWAPARVEQVLGVVASLLIIGLGVGMMVIRIRSLRGGAGSPSSLQEPPHDHGQGPLHFHSHGHTHIVPAGPLNLPGLIALGVSGGLVPCSGALMVLLAAISLGQLARGIVLILIFSLGMATVLVGMGLAIVKTADYTSRAFQEAPWQRYVPLASALLITLLGMVLLGRALLGHAH